MERYYYAEHSINFTYPKLIEDWKKDYYDKDFQKKIDESLASRTKYYAGASQNQSPYDFYASYSKKEQELLRQWVKLYLIPTKSNSTKVSTYAVKHWAEKFFSKWNVKGSGLTYVSTGAIKGALLAEGFSLKPYELNAMVGIKKASPAYDNFHYSDREKARLNWN